MSSWKIFLLCIAGILLFMIINCQYHAKPEQIHLSYTGDPTEMMVTWVTQSPVSVSMAEYGENNWTKHIHADVKEFKDGGSQRRVIYIHRAKLTNLIPGRHYQYRCGGPHAWSPIYFFKAMQPGSNWSPRLALFGDLGVKNAVSLSRLKTETSKGFYDAFIHDGDFAYDMDGENGQVGDKFMRMIEEIAAYVPYMTCVGDHEQAYNFSHYRERFSMPGDSEGFWYSFNIGPAHIIIFSTEVYYFTSYGKHMMTNQYKWLENDLKIANMPYNRAKHPWIITVAHKPMYCSSYDPSICQTTNRIRTGKFGLENLFYSQGVDLTFWAHEHLYERLWPVYDNKIYNGSYLAPYTNPKGPIHINLASAGFWIKMGPHRDVFPPWSAFRSSDYGYTRMLIGNDTHIYLEQVSEDKDGEIIDKITIIKEKHGYHAWK